MSHFVRLLALLICLGNAGTAAAEVERYEGSVEIGPESRQLSADLAVTVTARQSPLSSVRFYINKNFQLESLTCDICAGHSYARSGQGHIFMMDSVPLTVVFARPLTAGKKTRIHLRYSGRIANDNWANMVRPEWVELGLYASWFPRDPDSSAFTYDLDVNLPASYKLASSAAVRGGKGEWHLHQQQPTLDVIVIASGDLKRRVMEQGGVRVALDYVDIPEKEAERLFADVRSMLEFYTKWYGPAPTGSLELVIGPSPRVGGYSRPGLISFASALYKERNERVVRRMWAHEIAHLWWYGAPVASWEDWLNESFAEYSSWRHVRAVRGEEAFKRLLEDARKLSAGKPPVWGIDRNSSEAGTVLYAKGALCLFELEEMLGEEKFTAFASESYAKKIKTTAALLDLLQQRFSPDVRQRFEALLKQ